MSDIRHNIPEAPDQLAKWLEQKLLSGEELRELVIELELDRTTDSSLAIEQLLKNESAAVLQHGLNALSPEQLDQLIAHPLLLLDLQEHVLRDGGDYWARRLETHSAPNDLAEEWKRIRDRSAKDMGQVSVKVSRRSYFKWLLPMAVAASIVFALLRLIEPPPEPAPRLANWGWGKPGVLLVDLKTEPYLKHLAQVADEWFDGSPDTQEALAQRISQFIQGCDVLIDAKHPQLSPEDRQTLVNRCRQWRTALAEQNDRLRRGGNVDSVRREVDSIAQRLVDQLREDALSAV